MKVSRVVPSRRPIDLLVVDLAVVDTSFDGCEVTAPTNGLLVDDEAS